MQKFLPVRLPKARQTVPVILTICFLTLNPRFRKYIKSAATRLFIRLTWTAVPAALSLPGSISVMPMLFGNANNTYPEKFSKALQDFASRAKNFGYKGEIKNLDDVARCLASYVDSSRKKTVTLARLCRRTMRTAGCRRLRT